MSREADMSKPSATRARLYQQLMQGEDPTVRKLCHRCLTVKSKLAFSRLADRADGLRVYCRRCAAKPVHPVQVDAKRCVRCGHTKPLSAYNRKRDATTGVQASCKACLAEY